MFTDPQTVTINAVPHTLPRTESDGQTSSYTTEDGTLVLTVQHLETKNARVRHQVRVDFNKIAADPFVAGNSRLANASAYIVIDEPNAGQFTNTDLLNYVKGLVGWLTDANVTKVLAGEH